MIITKRRLWVTIAKETSPNNAFYCTVQVLLSKRWGSHLLM